MKRGKLVGKLLVYGIFLLSLSSWIPTSTVNADSHNWEFTDFAWKLRAYDTYIHFADTVYLDEWGWDVYPDNTYLFFYDVEMDGDNVEEWFIRSTNGNVTIQDFFVDSSDTTSFVWEGSGSGSVTLGCTTWGEPTYITIDGIPYYEGTKWTYDAVDNSITITESLSSHTVVVDWTPPLDDPPFFPPLIGNNRTYYYRSDSHTVNNVTGYRLSMTPSASLIEESRTDAGSKNVSYGVRVWVLSQSGTETELTDESPVAVVTRSSDGEGLQETTWNCPNYGSVVDAFVVRLYQRFDSETWSLRRIYVTYDEQMIKFPEETWTFYYYTNRTTSSTTGYFMYGDTAHLSRLDLQIYEADPWDIQLFEFISGNPLKALLVPWTSTLGSMFYGFALFFASITMYHRYGSLRVVLGILWLFGGAGSVLTLVLPLPGLGLAYVILLLAVGITLFDLFF